jgi:hypothetical protein
MVVIEIAQHKTNPEYVVLDGDAGDRALQNMRDGKYRRDPVVVKRESSATRFDVPASTFARPAAKKDPPNRVKFVQALHDQGYGVDDILKQGAYMKLSRREVVRYMSGRRPPGHHG